MPLTLPQVHQDLKLWEKIEIVVGDHTSEGRYVARIEDFCSQGIVISNPEFIGGSTLLRDNCHVAVLVTREDAVYQFHSNIRKISTQLRTIHLLTSPQSAGRVQRRQFVRIELYGKIAYANLTDDKWTTNSGGQIVWREATAINVSGGGILINVTDNLSAQDVLLMKISLFKKIGLPDTIAGICRRTFRYSKKLFAGIEFIQSQQLRHHFSKQEMKTLPQSVRDLNQSAQHKLAAYVFQEQIQLRRKGLL